MCHRYTGRAVTATTFGASPSRAMTFGNYILYTHIYYSQQDRTTRRLQLLHRFAIPGSQAPAPLNPEVVCITNSTFSKKIILLFRLIFFFQQLCQQSSSTFGFMCPYSQRDAFTPEQTWKAESLSGLIISGPRTASGYTCVTLKTARLNDVLVTENRSVFR